MEKPAPTVFQYKLTRRQFLIYLAGIVLAISGINAILKILNPTHPTGFGEGPYGGIKK